MSHAMGEVYHNEKLVGYYEYNGTSDFAWRRIFDDSKELWNKYWRTDHALWADCKCGEPPQDVILYSDYGNGFHWPSRACLKCHAIVGNTDPFNVICACKGMGICYCSPPFVDGRPFPAHSDGA